MLRAFGLLLVLLLVASGAAAANPPNPAQPDDPTQVQVAALINESTALPLPPRVLRAFLLTLFAVNDALQQDDAARARVLLKTFAAEVRGVKRAKRLPPAAADALIARAEAAIETCSGRDKRLEPPTPVRATR
jgi:hypothetical protein